MTKKTIPQVRDEIDRIDKQIYGLIKLRAQAATEIAKLKQASDPNPIYYRPEREAQILTKIIQANDSLISDRALKQIFRDIMTACLALQKSLTIAFLGPRGTFSQIAAETHFGPAANIIEARGIPEIFQQVASDEADYGIVPIENSTEGVVNLTMDELINHNLYICGEIAIPIHHCLMSNSKKLNHIKKIYSHQQSIAQCRNWINNNLPQADLIAVSSNSEAAKQASKKPASAAIGPQLAAEIYSLKIIQQNIEDSELNSTRFIILGKQQIPPSGKDKTSLLITTPHSPGLLYKLLQPFANHKVNLTLIESRPYRQQNWSYIFFIDLEGHQLDKNVQKALKELNQMSVMMKILGSYPSTQ